MDDKMSSPGKWSTEMRNASKPTKSDRMSLPSAGMALEINVSFKPAVEAGILQNTRDGRKKRVVQLFSSLLLDVHENYPTDSGRRRRASPHAVEKEVTDVQNGKSR
jgi:hypothetical protein